MTDDWVTVLPGPQGAAEVARDLLALARTVDDVRTTAGGQEFRVPPYLAELYTKPPTPKRRAAKPKEGDE
jgi:hypothetical protein